MTWSQFTKDNIQIFYNNKYNLDQNNKLLNLLRTERNNINQFIKNNKININIKLLKNKEITELDKKIKKYSNVFWVQDNLTDNINNLDINCLITWETFSIKQKNKITLIKPSLLNETTYINKFYIKTDRKTLYKFLKRIKYMILLFEYLKTKTNDNRKIEIYLILSKLEKIYPLDNSIIDVPNVNSGYTDLLEDYIFVWRQEEFEKVLIHEMIHFLNLEKRDHFNRSFRLPNIKGHVDFHEAFTDFWGILYHLIYINIVTNKSIKLLFEIELSFIKNQAKQMNNYMNLGTWNNSPNILVKQKTPAFSYYIVKYLLFEYLLNNDIHDNYHDTIIYALNKKLINENIININSSRMTLLQLN